MPKPATCKYCGAEGEWLDTERGWRLMVGGQVHRCERKPSEDNGVPTEVRGSAWAASADREDITTPPERSDEYMLARQVSRLAGAIEDLTAEIREERAARVRDGTLASRSARP